MYYLLAKGELNGVHAGRYADISRSANSLCMEQSPATVLIETAERNIIIKDYDSMTIVMRCNRTEE